MIFGEPWANIIYNKYLFVDYITIGYIAVRSGLRWIGILRKGWRLTANKTKANQTKPSPYNPHVMQYWLTPFFSLFSFFLSFFFVLFWSSKGYKFYIRIFLCDLFLPRKTRIPDALVRIGFIKTYHGFFEVS